MSFANNGGPFTCKNPACGEACDSVNRFSLCRRCQQTVVAFDERAADVDGIHRDMVEAGIPVSSYTEGEQDEIHRLVGAA